MTATPGMPEHGDLGDLINRLESRVGALERARRLQSAAIGSGGIRVLDGGQIVWIADDGTTHLVTADEDGILIAGAPVRLDADGLDIGNGLTVIDSSGVNVGSGKVLADNDGFSITDADGNVVFRRSVSLPWRPTRSMSPWPDDVMTTTSSSYVTLWRSSLQEVWEPATWVKVDASVDAAATTYDLLFAVFREGDATPTDSDEITGLSNTTFGNFARKFAISYDGSNPKGTRRHFHVRARRTSGAGTIRVVPHDAWLVGTLTDLPAEEG